MSDKQAIEEIPAMIVARHEATAASVRPQPAAAPAVALETQINPRPRQPAGQ